jgi:ATP-dependent Clp protease ATP-binding subunit ClpC
MIEHCSPETNEILRQADKIAFEFKQAAISSLEILYFVANSNNYHISIILKKYPELTKFKFNEYRNKKKKIINKWPHFYYNKQKRRNPTKFIHLRFSSETKKLLKVALYLSSVFESELLEPEHLLLAICFDSQKSTYAANFLLEQGINLDNLYKEILNIISGDEKIIFSPDMYNKMEHHFFMPPGIEIRATNEIFKNYTLNITNKANENLLDFIAGRSEEVIRLITILLRRRKNNCLLVGEPGVGKTSIIEALALRVRDQNVPSEIANLEILQLDMNALIAGTRYRGEFEERLKTLLDNFKNFSNFVLVIDDLHKIVRVTSSDGSLDAANMLKPALARGEFKCIGTTTNSEYRKTIQKDVAFDRRFQPMYISEPTIEQAIDILYHVSDRLQEHHNISITERAIIASVNLSQQYMNDRFLPDKAIDLLDEACTYVQSQGIRQPQLPKPIQDEIKKICYCKSLCIQIQDFKEAGRYRKLEQAVKEQIQLHSILLRDAYAKENQILEVEDDDIAHVIANWTGIPVYKLSKDEAEKLINMENIIHERIIGQNVAVTAISNAIRRARAGLKNPNRPIASFIFAGPTGVGKTELVKALAYFFFGSEKSMVRLDMSEYMERHNVSKLIGSPPGYIGFDEGGFLTEKVRNNSYTVVLFDEIEKAHPDVFNLLLQILEDGRLTDSQNRLIDFKNTLIILTSNIGSFAIQKESEMQLKSKIKLDEIKKYERMVLVVQDELKKNFRPEFLNRLDEIIVFQQLTQEDVRKIANILLKQLVDRILEQSKLVLFIDEDVKEKLAIDGFNPLYGARPLRRVIMNLVEDRLASLVLEKSYLAGTHLTLSLDEEENIIIAQTGFTKLVNENLSFKENFDLEQLNNKNPIQDVDSIIHDSIIFLKRYGFQFSE